MDNEIVLSFKNCTKVYPGVVAIDDISLDIKKGEIHAIVGENGAGKSTLIKCLSGAVQQERGTITFDGKKYGIMTPVISREAGIEVIYQELNLINGLTVAENVCFGEKVGKRVNYKLLNDKAKAVFEKMNIKMNPKKLVMELSVAQKQLVEIAKSISKNAKLLVMDEPTAPLTLDEIEVLFTIIKMLKKSGVTIIYISHRLDEIFKTCDRVTVMRDGKIIKTMEVAATDRQEIIKLMVGRTLKETFPTRNNITSEKVLEVVNVTGSGDVDISITVHRGEIVGLAGLIGAGRTELARMIFGADKRESGKILVNGKEINIKSPENAIKNGIGLIPEDRKQQGCFLFFGIDWNITIANIKNLSNNGRINFKKLGLLAKEFIDLLRIKTPSNNQLVYNLSGGNQQKVVIAKTLATKSKIMIFDEPTRGIDVGAKQEIYRLMTGLVDEGSAILMISSDMEELLGMSDRIYVMSEGKIVGELPKKEASQLRIMKLISAGE